MTFKALELLNSLTDPVLGLSVKEMGLHTTISEKDKHLTLQLQGGFPTQPLESSLMPILTSALQNQYPNYRISSELNFFVKAHRTQMLGQALRGVKNTIAIASGKGGVGKSTVTINLAAALTRAGARVGILDADIYGPSIPMMLGAHQAIQTEGDHYLPAMVHGIQAMSIGYLTDNNQALIWRGPMLAKSLIQMINSTLWDNLDYLLIDLPPGTGDIQLSLVQKIPLTAAVIVTTPQNIATLDAQKAIQMFESTGIEVLGLIENMSLHVCSKCGHHDAIFGEKGAARLGKEYEIPLLGQLPLDSRIRQQCDEGTPTALQNDTELADVFMKTAMTMAIKLAQKPINYAGKFPPIKLE